MSSNHDAQKHKQTNLLTEVNKMEYMILVTVGLLALVAINEIMDH